MKSKKKNDLTFCLLNLSICDNYLSERVSIYIVYLLSNSVLLYPERKNYVLDLDEMLMRIFIIF